MLNISTGPWWWS